MDDAETVPSSPWQRGSLVMNALAMSVSISLHLRAPGVTVDTGADLPGAADVRPSWGGAARVFCLLFRGKTFRVSGSEEQTVTP